MADKRCSISLVVNGQRWLEEGATLAEQAGTPRPWSLCGLQDFVRITVGAKLGYTFENTDFVEQRWFAGVHSNVGGGYPDEGLADLALKWIIEKASYWQANVS